MRRAGTGWPPSAREGFCSRVAASFAQPGLQNRTRARRWGDVVLVGAGASRREIHDYTGRLIRDLNFPAVVLPTHWDNFLAPYGASQQPAIDALQSFVQEVRAVSPKTKVIVPKAL